MNTPKLQLRARQLKALAENEQMLREEIAALKEAHGIDALEECAKEHAARQKELRAELAEWYTSAMVEWRNGADAPRVPAEMTFASKDELFIDDADLIPREACAPVTKLLETGMPGVATRVKYWVVLK